MEQEPSFLKTSDPYQWFFPLGIMAGLLGVGLWLGFAIGLIPFYPGVVHSETMIGGFLLLVGCGFLMTAMPRFTGTPSATPLEKISLFIPAVLSLLSIFCTHRLWFHVLLFIELITLITFGFKRLKKRNFTPPPSFPLAGMGILSALMGVILFLMGDFFSLPLAWVNLGKLFFFYGLIYGMTLGIGTQLIPRFIGTHPSLANSQLPTPMHGAADSARLRLFFTLCGVILYFSFVTEAFVSTQGGRILRAVLVSLLMGKHWYLHLKPRTPGLLSKCLWVSGWMLLIGSWPGVFSPQFAIHGAHLLFIGSVSLMIFSISTRVILAHGGHDRSRELDSKALYTMLTFLMIALGARLGAPFTANYFNHLAYASGFWMIACAIWAMGFFPPLFKRK